MTETAQPATAAESEVASDPFADAANAFKTFDANAPESPERLRDEKGRFASTEPEQEIEAEEPEALADETEAESHEDVGETDEAAEEAQPEAIDLPTSWPSEHAEAWQSLPPETRAIIAEREGQRDAAVNAKFQEAANLRKAHEAEINEAQTNRQRFAEAADFVLSLVQPQEPPVSMLNPNSADYNPDGYHLAKAQYDQTVRTVQAIAQQRQQVAQQQAQAENQQREVMRSRIEETYQPRLIKDVPDLADPNKQMTVLNDIARYAIDNGIPEHFFTDPEFASSVTSADLHIAWKAMQYDKMVAAKAKVTPKSAKPAAPVVKPGVTTSRSAVEKANRTKALNRLEESGSLQDAAAFIKNLKF